ncbi:MAG: alpha-hydroxy acid oxidase, partial [Pseudomonadota bacterium]
KPFWFQLYVMRDREFAAGLIDRAKAAGCSALILTLDLQMIGQRHKDIKNGLGAPPKLTVKNIINIGTKWRWCAGMAATHRRTFRNIVGHAKGVTDMGTLHDWTSAQFDQSLTWDDIAWIRDRWGGKFIIKGILDVEDARTAVKYGADAIIVSNHGGRQLDGALSSIAMLPSIAEAVGDQTEVWLDSGIRSGQDILKAMALGARATLVGRAMAYGLGAMGREGVTSAIEVIRKELDTTLGLVGRTDVSDLNRDNLIFRSEDPWVTGHNQPL